MNKKLNITLEKGEYISKENNVLYIHKKLENYLREERKNHKFKMGNREYYSEYYVEKENKRLNNIINKGIEYILGNDLDNFNNINNLLNILKGYDKNDN